MRAKSLVLETGAARVAWLTVDLVGIDPSLLARVGEGLRAAGLDGRALQIVLAVADREDAAGLGLDLPEFAQLVEAGAQNAQRLAEAASGMGGNLDITV